MLATQVRLPYTVVRLPISENGYALSSRGFVVARAASKGDAVITATAMSQHTAGKYVHEVLRNGSSVFRAG